MAVKRGKAGTPWRDRCPLGVLFVHGIGQQVPGETLGQASDAMFDYFGKREETARWTELEEVLLRPRVGPSRARLRFGRSPADGSATDHSWLLAESWWAESFLPGRFQEMVGWAVRSLPYALLVHVGSGLRRRWGELRDARGAWRSLLRCLPLASSALQLVVAPLVALVVMVILLLLALLALAPWAALRAPASWLQRKLASTLGDSAILLQSETNRVAMIDKIRADIRWLAARAERVVVVAHSQGAALSWEALLERVPIRARDFRTFGSGLRKLLQLRFADRPGRRRMSWAWTSSLAQILALVLAYWLASGLEPGTDRATLVGLGTFFVLVLVATSPLMVRSSDSERRPTCRELLSPAMSMAGLVVPVLLALRPESGWAWPMALPFVVLNAVFGAWVARDLNRRCGQALERLLMVAAALGGAALASLVWWVGDALVWQGVICLAAALLLLAVTMAGAMTENVVWERVRLALDERGVTWQDWYASHDLVPVGHFVPLGDDSKKITNCGQPLRDHTSYWENRDEFVADLARSLAGCVGWELPEVGQEVRERRRWRVGVLRASSWVAWLAVPLALWLRRARLGEIGESAFAGAGELLAVLPWRLGESLPEQIAGRQMDFLDLLIVVGALITVLPILASKTAFAAWWRSWDHRESSRALRGRTYRCEKQPRYALWLGGYLGAIGFFCSPVPLGLMKLPLAVFLGAFVGAIAAEKVLEDRAPPAPVP